MRRGYQSACPARAFILVTIEVEPESNETAVINSVHDASTAPSGFC